MTSFAVGKMDRQIYLQTATVSNDPDTNEEIKSWDGEIVAAEWLPAGTREAFQAQERLGAYIDGVFKIHYRDPRPRPEANQIIFEERTYDIKGVTEIARKRGLEIAAIAHAEAP